MPGMSLITFTLLRRRNPAHHPHAPKTSLSETPCCCTAQASLSRTQVTCQGPLNPYFLAEVMSSSERNNPDLTGSSFPSELGSLPFLRLSPEKLFLQELREWVCIQPNKSSPVPSVSFLCSSQVSAVNSKDEQELMTLCTGTLLLTTA